MVTKLHAFRVALRSAELRDRVALEREGVPVDVVRDLLTRTGVKAETLQRAIGVQRVVPDTKTQGKRRIGGAPGYAIVGIIELINAVEEMVRRDPAEGAESFDAERWVGHWIQMTIPALAGQRPIDLMDTAVGREAVMRVLAADREGVFL